MRNLTVFTLASIVVLGGCDLLKKKDADAGAEAGLAAEVLDAAPPNSTPVTAANESAVARFKTETALDEDRVIASVTTPRTSPGGGTVVATLKVGTQVERIASNGKDSLIQFPDPANPTVTLMGWVTDSAFTAAVIVRKPVDAGADSGKPADAGTVATTVDAGAPVVDAGPAKVDFACPPGGKVPVLLNGKPVCRNPCTKNEECKNKVCSTGTAPPPKGGSVKVCLTE